MAEAQQMKDGSGSQCKCRHYHDQRVIIYLALTMVCLPPQRHSRAANLDELKGLSIEISYSLNATFRSRSNPAALDPPITQQSVIQLYISYNGNVFEDRRFSPNPKVTRQWQAITPLNRAAKSRPDIDQLQTWTLEDGQLVKVIKLPEGFEVSTISVDPARLSCSFDNRLVSDPATGRIVVSSAVDNLRSEIYSRTTIVQFCKVVKGNVFGSEQ